MFDSAICICTNFCDQLFAAFGILVARKLSFNRGTKASSYTQLYVAFLLSGFIHSVADAMVGWHWAGTSVPFFLVQAVAITAEDIIIALCNRIGFRKRTFTTQALGYAWVFAWGVYSFSMYRDLAIRAGWGWATRWALSPVDIFYKLAVQTG